MAAPVPDLASAGVAGAGVWGGSGALFMAARATARAAAGSPGAAVAAASSAVVSCLSLSAVVDFEEFVEAFV
ncbi:hypothetical protein PSO31014_03626 [Pandoraea soli]|uniref:Secreted protein n=1 Tax=Pandoraea soli TaxID=2508293 RepID=A0ABY6WDC4_9BURK|nr:hypothetical protein PSO31014_03626 [Pandoraea soli]